MKKIAVTTWCTDDYVDYIGLDELRNSFKYFHSDVDFFVFDTITLATKSLSVFFFTSLPLYKQMISRFCIRLLANNPIPCTLDSLATTLCSRPVLKRGCKHGLPFPCKQL